MHGEHIYCIIKPSGEISAWYLRQWIRFQPLKTSHWLRTGWAFFRRVPSIKAATRSSGAPFAWITWANSANFDLVSQDASNHRRCFHQLQILRAVSWVIRENRDLSHPNCISMSENWVGYARHRKSMHSAVTQSSFTLVIGHWIHNGRSMISTNWWTSAWVKLWLVQV